MGKPTGFMEYNRILPADRDPSERIADWQEFHTHLEEEQLRKQGARCMDCGIPFCQSGTILHGSVIGCPIHNLIPEWNDLVYRGRWKEALERLEMTNNFPEFTGRVCPAPCESACTAGLNGDPVTIKQIEYEIVERGFKEGWIRPRPPKFRTGKRVAIVGSGPAGLAAAAQLNKAGHTVTVYERDDRIGGLLMYGIPNMKLDKVKVVERRVNLLREEGIRFVTNTEIGKDISVEQLIGEYDAVVLCTGATKPRDLAIEGRGLKGIHFAMEYLTKSIKEQMDGTNPDAGAPDAEAISAKGKDVIVIGGGDTGTDCVATAIRQGCRSVTQFQHNKMEPLKRDGKQPWPLFPKIYKIDYGQEEAKAIYGTDPRSYSTSTVKFVGDENGRVKELHTVQVEFEYVDGKRIAKEIPGTEKVWPAQLVLLAMGFLGPEDTLLNQLNIERDERSNVKAAFGKFATNIPGVFAAGDIRRGQSLVVWAIAEGRGAARAVDEYLMGSSLLPN